MTICGSSIVCMSYHTECMFHSEDIIVGFERSGPTIITIPTVVSGFVIKNHYWTITGCQSRHF